MNTHYVHMLNTITEHLQSLCQSARGAWADVRMLFLASDTEEWELFTSHCFFSSSLFAGPELVGCSWGAEWVLPAGSTSPDWGK